MMSGWESKKVKGKQATGKTKRKVYRKQAKPGCPLGPNPGDKAGANCLWFIKLNPLNHHHFLS